MICPGRTFADDPLAEALDCPLARSSASSLANCVGHVSACTNPATTALQKEALGSRIVVPAARATLEISDSGDGGHVVEGPPPMLAKVSWMLAMKMNQNKPERKKYLLDLE